MKQVIMYTDGACRRNPGPGGWGVLIKYEGIDKEIFGAKHNTTNNQMELTAAIEGLVALKEPCSVVLYTDSKYVMDGITQWIYKWKKITGDRHQKKMLKIKNYGNSLIIWFISMKYNGIGLKVIQGMLEMKWLIY